MTDEQRRLLDDHLQDAIFARGGRVVIESYYERLFNRAGIDVVLLTACFEDNLGDYAGTTEDYGEATHGQD